jgi:putative hydrolase of the HAD superfamily
MRLEAVLFDLDGTLLDRRATFRHFLQDQLERHSHLLLRPGSDGHLEDLLAFDHNGMTDRDEFYLEVERRVPLHPGSGAELRADFEERFPGACIPMHGLTETLETLRRWRLRLGLITNGRVLMQRRKIAGLGLGPLLDAVVISEAAGCRKPDPRIFALALDELGVGPRAAAFVGDNPDADVAGARGSGLLAVWKRDPFWPEPSGADWVIDELPELLPRMAELG